MLFGYDLARVEEGVPGGDRRSEDQDRVPVGGRARKNDGRDPAVDEIAVERGKRKGLPEGDVRLLPEVRHLSFRARQRKNLPGFRKGKPLPDQAEQQNDRSFFPQRHSKGIHLYTYSITIYGCK